MNRNRKAARRSSSDDARCRLYGPRRRSSHEPTFPANPRATEDKTGVCDAAALMMFPVACRPSIGTEAADLDSVMRDGNKGDTDISKYIPQESHCFMSLPPASRVSHCTRTLPPQTR